MTVKAIKQVEQEVEIEVSFPSYFKNGDKYYAFLEENKMISLSLLSNDTVQLLVECIMWKYDAKKITESEEITEDDFQFALGMALERLSKFQTENV